ncbi:MAG: transcriptional repressor [Gammaproteobacteria bacterium]|nr:transcriptional repressor [Gammaproteobacteria bacterium]
METDYNYPLSRDDVHHLLQARQILPTQQRVAIAEFMFQRSQHLVAEAVRLGVNEAGCPVSKATVYNTLGLFVRKGLLREVLVDSGRTFYDSNPKPHHHLFNLDSGELLDIDAAGIDIKGLPTLSGVVLQGVELLIKVRNVDL